VALRYLDVYELKANLQVAQDAYLTLKKLYSDGENRLAVGLIDENELLKFKVNLDAADITVKKARADLEKSISLLAKEVSVPVTLNQLKFEEFTNQPPYGEPLESERRMLVDRSELKALREASKAAMMHVKVAESGYYPRVDLVESYTKYDDDYINGHGNIGSRGEDLRTQVVLSMNLFNGKNTESAVGKAKLEVRGLQYDLKEMENNLKTSLKNLYIDYKVSLDNINVAKENIKHAKENLRVTQLKYNEGLQRESDLLDAITSLSRARYNYVSVNRGAFLNHFQITRMMEGFSQK
jgi:outer membrane protein TolC